MSIDRTKTPAAAFTLIEMMVVVAIIGLLLAALLPAFGAARKKARYAQAEALFNGLDGGLALFRGETSLSGSLPPSASDKPEDRQLIANPRRNHPNRNNGGEENIKIAGAHLLAHAMLGADLQGTPGFQDVDRDGYWWNDTHDDDEGGVYGINDDTGEELHTRYGGAGFVDEKMRRRLKSLGELEEVGLILNLDTVPTPPRDEPLFVDPWDMPILYYRANAASLRIVGDVGEPGIYWQADNAIITGADQGNYASDGLDFGTGKIGGSYHALFGAESPDPMTEHDVIAGDPTFAFAEFIRDRTVAEGLRLTPVRRDSYLLISAGPDFRYGTADDVTNWKREEK